MSPICEIWPLILGAGLSEVESLACAATGAVATAVAAAGSAAEFAVGEGVGDFAGVATAVGSALGLLELALAEGDAVAAITGAVEISDWDAASVTAGSSAACAGADGGLPPLVAGAPCLFFNAATGTAPH